MTEWYDKLSNAFYIKKQIEDCLEYLSSNILPDRQFLSHGCLIDLDKIERNKQ